MSARAERLILGLVLVGAWVLRASPFFRPTGVLGWPVDYDEGVYLAASHALLSGSLPWRDFAFLHPPGILLIFAPLTSFEPRTALAAARWLATLAGVLNVGLIFAIVRSRARFPAALLACMLYASWSEAAIGERQAFIEPVLNVACLSLTLAVVRRWPDALIGTLIAAALCLKAWAVFWVLGALLASTSPREALRRLAWSLPLVSLIGLVFALRAPGEAVHQLLVVHALRPPDGDLERWVRLREMFIARNPLPGVLLAGALPALWRNRAEPLVRMLGLVLPLVVLSFLSAAAFWNQYDAHLAAVMAPAVGLGLGLWAKDRRQWMIAGLALVSGVPGTVAIIERRHEASTEQQRTARLIAEQTTAADSVCSLEAAAIVVGNRWPGPPFDSYGQQLSDAARTGRFPSTEEAFAQPAAQRRILEQLRACTALVPSERDGLQLTEATRLELRAHFQGPDSGLLRRE